MPVDKGGRTTSPYSSRVWSFRAPVHKSPIFMYFCTSSSVTQSHLALLIHETRLSSLMPFMPGIFFTSFMALSKSKAVTFISQSCCPMMLQQAAFTSVHFCQNIDIFKVFQQRLAQTLPCLTLPNYFLFFCRCSHRLCWNSRSTFIFVNCWIIVFCFQSLWVLCVHYEWDK